MRLSLGAALCFVCTLSWAADPAHAAIRKDTQIPAEGLGVALQTLAKTFEFQILYPTPIVKDLKTSGASGSLTADEALRRVLDHTGLSYKYLDASTVTVFSSSAQSSPPTGQGQTPTNTQDKEGKSDSSEQFRVAQLDQTPAGPQVEDTKEEEKKKSVLQEVVVTGSRIPTTAKESVQEVHVYTREQIDQTGQTTVVGFLNTLSEVSVNSTPTGTANFAGETSVQLRGLPLGTTLVLLNGQRVGGHDTIGFFDLNSIPAAAVERIEVLPTGSSAIYGSDAIAGVINIIMAKPTGLAIDGQYGGAAGVRDSNVGVSWGVQGDRGSLSFAGTYVHQGELPGSDRSLVANADYRRFGGVDNRTTVCSPGNVFSTDGSNLPGLGSPSAGDPATLGPGPTHGFNPTNLNECSDNATSALIDPSKRWGFVVSGAYHLTSYAEVFADVVYNHDQTHDTNSQVGFYRQTMPASNPFNPFGVDVLVDGTINGIPPAAYERDAMFVSPVVGIRAKLPEGWGLEVTVAEPHADQTVTIYGTNPTTLTAAFDSTDPATAFNPFTVGPPVASTSELGGFLAVSSYRDTSRTLDANAVAHGPLFKLPAGEIELAVGVEYMDDHEFSVSPFSVATDYLRTVRSIFGEARIPILPGRDDSQSAPTLVGTLADRLDSYGDFGSTSNPQFGLEWRPIGGLLLRASHASAFQAPNLVDLYSPPFVIQQVVFDPLNKNEAVQVPTTIGGNPHLKPQTGSSESVGLGWVSSGLTGSVTWWRIEEENRLTGLGVQTFVSNESLFPGRVVRGPSQNGNPGQIESVDGTVVNFGGLDVAGVDFDTSYKIETRLGQFVPGVSATTIYRYQAALIPGAPLTDRLGVATLFDAWAPRWKGNVSLGWKSGPYTLNATGRYVGKYQDYSPLTNGTYQTLGNFWLFDTYGRYDFRSGSKDSVSWSRPAMHADVGVVNALNRLPQYSTYSAGYDPFEADIRGRYIYARLGLKW